MGGQVTGNVSFTWKINKNLLLGIVLAPSCLCDVMIGHGVVKWIFYFMKPSFSMLSSGQISFLYY